MPKLTAASGTNQYTGTYDSTTNKMLYKAIGGGQALAKTKSLDPTYNISSITYNGIFEFAKAQNIYYTESTAESRAQTYEPYKQALKHNVEDFTTLEQVSKHTLELLVNTCKEEVNKNILLNNTVTELKNELIRYKDNSVILKLENKQMRKRYTTRLEQAEKNRKDPHHREQLIKYSLLMLFGFILFGLIKYL